MDIPSWRVAILTVITLASLSSNPHAIAMAPANSKAMATESPIEPKTSYEVQSGDTLWKIVQQFQIDLDQLMSLNPALRQSRPVSGMKLLLPNQPMADKSVQAAIQPVIAVQNQVAYARSGEQLQVRKVFNCKLTAYTAGPESTGKSPGDPAYGVTFSGTKAEEGRTVAVDPKLIPIGSKIYIEGIGFRTAEDTGSAIQGEHIDVFMNDMPTAVEFGVKKGVSVYLLN